MRLQGRSGRAGRVEAGHYQAFSLFLSVSLLLFGRVGVKRCHILSLAALWEADTISYASSGTPSPSRAHLIFIFCSYFSNSPHLLFVKRAEEQMVTDSLEMILYSTPGLSFVSFGGCCLGTFHG